MLDGDALLRALDSPGHTLQCKASLTRLLVGVRSTLLILGYRHCQHDWSVDTHIGSPRALLHRVSYPDCWYCAVLGTGEQHMCPHARKRWHGKSRHIVMEIPAC